jgi:hypothetical protein
VLVRGAAAKVAERYSLDVADVLAQAEQILQSLVDGETGP